MIYSDHIHIVADSVDELHKWARNVGLKRHFFEGVKKGHPHYDVPKSWNIADTIHRMVCAGRVKSVGSKELLKISKQMIL